MLIIDKHSCYTTNLGSRKDLKYALTLARRQISSCLLSARGIRWRADRWEASICQLATLPAVHWDRLDRMSVLSEDTEAYLIECEHRAQEVRQRIEARQGSLADLRGRLLARQPSVSA